MHVRNKFTSMVDKQSFTLNLDFEPNQEVAKNLGRTMTVRDLAYHMITTSSNFATNLLIDVVGVPAIQRALEELKIDGVILLRGVSDEAAFKAGLNNQVTANGLVKLLRVIAEGRAWSPEICAQMLEILLDQQFKSGIPAGLPGDVHVAHKTGQHLDRAPRRRHHLHGEPQPLLPGDPHPVPGGGEAHGGGGGGVEGPLRDAGPAAAAERAARRRRAPRPPARPPPRAEGRSGQLPQHEALQVVRLGHARAAPGDRAPGGASRPRSPSRRASAAASTRISSRSASCTWYEHEQVMRHAARVQDAAGRGG